MGQRRRQEDQFQWGYEDDDEQLGPSEWAKFYHTGKAQSPINILVDFCALSANVKGACCHHERQQRNNNSERSDRSTHSSLTCCGHLSNGASSKHVADNNPVSQQGGGATATLAAGLRRTHLDSIGEDVDHQRSSSTSSAESSGSTSSSPIQHNDSSCDDDYDLTMTTRSNKHRSSPATTTTTTPNCFSKAATVAAAAARQPQQNTRLCMSNKKLFLGYPRYMSGSVRLCNTGHSWQIDIPPELSAHTLLSGPPLGDREYRLAQVHAHWGEDCSHGSEHQINGRSYAAEIHFVHWNCTDFRSVEEASRNRHGLAVLGVLVMALEGEHNKNKHLEKIVSGLKQVRKPYSSAELNTNLDLKKLFPANRWSYATYEGSLTTPPLSEVVDWIVFLNPITCSTGQIEQFQQIHCESGRGSSRMRKNCRPIQPTNNRLVSIWTHSN